jgi:hypothetical protein
LSQKVINTFWEDPIEEKHNGVTLRSTRAPRMPTTLVEKGAGQRGLKELKVEEEGSILMFDRLCRV